MLDVLLKSRPLLSRIFALPFLLCAGLILPVAVHAAPTEDGLYATFQITRSGNAVGEFTCRLEFLKAPRTVANFVGLAEGSFPFVDFQNGNIAKRRYYDGITFHRVEAGFIIQGGSPQGDGSDGPGYTFPDEFDITLRHSSGGILSMANNGLNSNGSQFFVTLAATPGLDNVHSVFGEVVEGMDVVTNVQQGDVIQSATITRNGAAALAFDVTAHGVPVVLDAEPALEKSPGGFELNYVQPANTEFFVFHSDDFDSWSQLDGQEMHGLSPTTIPRDVTSVTSGRVRQFFTVGEVLYADAIRTPPQVTGRKLTLTETGGAQLKFSLTSATSGTYTYEPPGEVLGPFAVTGYTWKQEAYRGRFIGGINGLNYQEWPINQTSISFIFTSSTGGTYKGYLFNTVGQRAALGGTFVMAALPN
jgi:cyclophilin family peptidyl-prolyl cis-trans isomerase